MKEEIKIKRHKIGKNGLPLLNSDGRVDKVESLEDADILRNNLYQSGHYGVMSKCMAAGINGDWEYSNGVCPIYRLDKSECSCEQEMIVEFDEILLSENNKQ